MKLKILIVDDSRERTRDISLVVEARDADWEVSYAADVTSAKAALSSGRFDLMLLDINLPRRASRDPEPDGGLEVLRWLRGRGKTHMPGNVVAITAYDKSEILASNEVKNLIWRVVHTRASENSWKAELDQTLSDIEAFEPLPIRGDGATYRTDLLVIAALPKPELAAILELPAGFKRVTVPFDATDYYSGKFADGDRSLSVVAAAASDKGLAGAAIAATKAILTFWPRYIIMPGITAGIKGRSNIGDVVFADLSWDWGSGKLKRVGRREEFLPAPFQRRLNETLSRGAKMLESEPEFLKERWLASANVKPSVMPVVRVGAMASGASVLQSSAAVKKVISQHKDLLAIEMEAFSLMFAAETSPVPRPLAIVAKSVCDNGDGKKNDKYQKFCAEMSAHAVHDFALRFLTEN